MSISYTRARVRLAVDCSRRDAILDAVTGETPSIWRGTDLSIELSFWFADLGLVDVSGFSSITVEIRDAATRTSLVLATKTLASGDLNPDLTADQWEAATHQHGAWEWSASETRWALGGQTERTFWLVVHGITSDARSVTFGGTPIILHEDGAGEASSSPEPGDPLYLTADETRALLGQVIRPGNNPAGTTITLTSPNGQWARIIGVDDVGAPIDAIAAIP